MQEENRSLERRIDVVNAQLQSTQEDLDHVNENYANCKIELATTQKRFADATNGLDSMRIEMQKNMEGKYNK